MKKLKISNKHRTLRFPAKLYHCGVMSYTVEFEHDKYNFFDNKFKNLSQASSYMRRICDLDKSELDDRIKYSA